eukprot:m.13328 g.13328  ORF g.13328 m.13328 type:complete len:229 (-) comp4833_c0_seq1:73-759(-)
MPKKLRPVVTEDGIDFKELEQVVNNQLAADAKYDREDAAKFRAVNQRVATYDEFENIVKGAHLSPMKEDVANLQLKRTHWSSSGRSDTRRREAHKTDINGTKTDEVSDGDQHGKNQDSSLPDKHESKMTSVEFIKTMNAIKDSKEMALFIANVDPERLNFLFGKNLSDEHIMSIFRGATHMTPSKALPIINKLKSVERFDMVCMFLSDGDKQEIQSIISDNSWEIDFL